MSKQMIIALSIIVLSVPCTFQLHAQQAKKSNGHQEEVTQNNKNPKASTSLSTTALIQDSKDPVCNMKVTKGSTITAIHNKKQFGFCSESCRAGFIKAPDNYLKNR